ncbi:MAG: hypothetical protein ACFFA3_19905 [Promethearchaeota archaeon]
MAENKSIVSFIALILAIAGIGIGVTPYILPKSSPQESKVITGMWSAIVDTDFQVPLSSLTYIPNLIIDYNIAEGENSYFVYNGLIEFETPGFVQFVFWISGDTYPEGFTTIDIPNLGSNVTIPVSLFYTLYSFSGGSHNVTVSVYSDSAATLFASKLLIQTFIEP